MKFGRSVSRDEKISGFMASSKNEKKKVQTIRIRKLNKDTNNKVELTTSEPVERLKVPTNSLRLQGIFCFVFCIIFVFLLRETSVGRCLTTSFGFSGHRSRLLHKDRLKSHSYCARIQYSV